MEIRCRIFRGALSTTHLPPQSFTERPSPLTQPRSRRRRREAYLQSAVSNSAATWRGLPSADTCEVASVSNNEGQETVTARVLIHASVAQVWRVLLDFEKLPEVVPHLVTCKEVSSPNPNYKRIQQSAGIKCSWWKLQAQALLQIQLKDTLPSKKELHFNLIEGDFKEYRGRFLVEAEPNGLATVLVFDAVIEPLENVPQMLFAHAVQIWLPFNLDGIVKKAEQIAQKHASVSPFTEASLESQVSIGAAPETALSRKRSVRKIPSRKKRPNPATYLGTAFVPLPSSAPEFPEISAPQQSTLPAFDLDFGQLEGVEVHLRKLDTPEELHRRVVCSLRIGAPVASVWKVLTDYTRLVEFVPNLAKSEVLPCPPGAPAGYHRLRQVVQKFQTYIQLQAESVMDVLEKPQSEIQFRQVSGFVQKLQGKWMLKSLKGSAADTLLTYALEIRTPHSEIPLELIEPVFEQAAVEGLPLNLRAIKNEVLRLEGRPSLARLCGDFQVVRDELIRCYSGNIGGIFPTRLQLRKDKRTDLEKAVTAHGGPSEVSARMGWKLQNKRRKPRGYWGDFDNLKAEMLEFCAENGAQLNGKLPSKSDFNQAGRVDLRRAVEKWGGIQSVMELMELEEQPQGNAVELSSMQRLPKMDIDVREMDRF